VDGDDYTQWLNSFLFAGPRLGGASPAPVPEPATAVSFAAGALGLMVYAGWVVARARRVGHAR